MKIPENMIVNSVEHRFGGNGWAVVAAYPGEWASVVYIGKGAITNQFFSVWTKLLKTETGTEKDSDGNWHKTNDPLPIEPKLLTKIKQIRDELTSGRSIIKDTRLVRV